MYSARAHNMYSARLTSRQSQVAARRVRGDEIVSSWQRVLRDWDSEDDSVYKGARSAARELVRMDSIPDRLRSDVWFYCSGARELYDKNSDAYEHLCECETKDADQIGRDVGRTFTSYGDVSSRVEERELELELQLELEREREIDEERSLRLPMSGVSEDNLRRVLTAYAVFDPRLGYCQGMNFICALILILCRDETRAFWIFVVIIKRVRGLFVDGLPGYNKAVHYFEKLYAYHLPDLASYFGKHEIRAHLFCTSWFHSLFAYPSLNIHVTKRIWDVFVIYDFTALIRISFTILAMNKNILMKLDFVHAVEFLKNLPFLQTQNDADALVRKAFTIRLREQFINPLTNLNNDHDDADDGEDQNRDDHLNEENDDAQTRTDDHLVRE